jgi:hypothetical protein
MAETVEKRTRRDYGIEPLEFRNAWNTSDTPQEATNKLTVIARSKGKLAADEVVPKAIVLARAAVYRKKNIELKEMKRRNPRKLDVASINATPVPATA